MKIFTLDNNLKIIYNRRENSPNISLNFRISSGSAYEMDDEIGVAHFLEHIVFDGTRKYPSSYDISSLVEDRGAYRNGSTGKESIEYVVKILKDDLEVAFEYLSQILIYPLFKEEDIEREKKIIEQEINRFKSDPNLLSSRMMYSLLFPGIRFGGLNTGDVEDVYKINRDKILGFFSRTHCAENSILSIVGDVPEDLILTLSKKYFGQMNRGSKISKIDVEVDNIEVPKVEVIPHLKQSTLMIGYRGFIIGTKEQYATDIITRILSRGKSSRLVNEIRGKHGLAYSVNASNLSLRNTGLFTIKVGLSESNIEQCVKIIKDELIKLQQNILTEGEISRALSAIKSGLNFSLEDSLSEASFNLDMWDIYGSSVSSNELFEYYEGVAKNPEFIKEVAKRLFYNKPSILILASQNIDIKW